MPDKAFDSFQKFRIPEEPVTAAWKSPSNIAIVKYWGKRPGQLPANPSLSFSLSASCTSTRVTFDPAGPEKQLEFLFEGKSNPAFAERIKKYLGEVSGMLPFLEKANLTIESGNTFPHSSGIASSASSFSALALCLSEIAAKLSGIENPEMMKAASSLARMGSGSAARSVYGGFTVWGNTGYLPGSSDEFAIPVPAVNPVFEDLRDAIIIVDSGTKKVSSSAGHSRMTRHPFASARIAQAQHNTGLVLEALKTGDVETFIRITEQEALTLHALMMTSDPGFILMEPESVRIMNRIRELRELTGLKICFTLDAGPNIHLIFFGSDYEQVKKLIVEDLIQNDKQINWINDKIGTGPAKIV